MNNAAKIRYLYLAALVAAADAAGDCALATSCWRRAAATWGGLQDIWWALLNSNEFILIH